MKKTTLLLTALLTITFLFARRDVNNTNKGSGVTPTPTAGCATAVAKATLSLNNVRTRIEATGGSMWQDRANGVADYEVPKRNLSSDPKFTSIFAGSLWMGGTTPNGQLKIAAVTFRASGNDFWPGPLNTSTAEIDAATCAKFDQFYGVSRSMVNRFVAWYQSGIDDAANGTTTQADSYPGYQIPDEILNWPAHGDLSLGQEWHLAPFFDRDGDDFYDPNSGDYPKYDLVGDIDCRTTRDVRLFGDTTVWFVFNDKGNVHQESNGPSIGMEIRGQAFAFATNDEINDMTFYNYEMINRSVFTLEETYFGQWVDADLGNSTDDFVGCDASRGLGYCYNGDQDDETNGAVPGYGSTPPAIGVDFFEGPFADSDYEKIGGGITTNINDAVLDTNGDAVGIDNPLTEVIADALDSNGIPYPGLGIGYGDGIVDNERYGMRKFVYYNIGGGVQGDPSSQLHYYNYLKGIWKDGSQMVWGGTGHNSSGGTIPADILFPGDSDPLLWSTQDVSVPFSDWSEINPNGPGSTGNPPGDRRFLQSAGPFTLEPGAVNDLTVGIVFARASSGDNFASVSALKVADDKAQALFDNCFKIVEGPDAPNVTFQELDQELILYLTNPASSNNANESYNLKNPFIAIPDTLDGFYQGSEDDKDTLKFYEFQGYQVYQVKNGLVTVSELNNPDLARPAFQVDIKDGITTLINHVFIEDFQINAPFLMVQGKDNGIKHSFRITTDLFATDNPKLVNHKTYYYMAIAYGYNEFKHYDPLDPGALDGQTTPYIASRKLAGGRGITSFSAIPHNPAPENGGTKANSEYGDMPQITRKEGQGNGGNELELTAATEATIVANNFADDLVYQVGKGPISVKVIDPLKVKEGRYQVQFVDTTSTLDLSDAFWMLLLPSGIDTITSDQAIGIENEQIFLTEGISISIVQAKNPGVERQLGNGVISSSIEYGASGLAWLTGFSDRESQTDQNWIRSGENLFGSGQGSTNSYKFDPYDDYHEGAPASPAAFVDPNQNFENLINGTWAPYRLVSSLRSANGDFIDALGDITTSLSNSAIIDALGYSSPGIGTGGISSVYASDIANTPSVDIVFTSDKNKWSRSIVLESRNDPNLADGGGAYLRKRVSNSVDKNGNDDGTGTGMGWFPGYAINLETGERLNIAFAEDSWLAGENGRDMKWNPTSVSTAGVNQELVLGGKHYVYVFRSDITNGYPAYDESKVLDSLMSLPINAPGGGNFPFFQNAQKAALIWEKTCVWAGIPMLAPGQTLLSTTAKVKLRVAKPYNLYTTASTVNNGLPLYDFDMTGMEVEIGNEFAMDSALALINVVPNPYYAFSEYETHTLDKRIKITNLPEECTISIYNVNGTLMRRFQKADPKTSLDWELTNQVDVPIASGVYLIHIKVPNIGERTLKWFGVMKPTDLNGFN
ncbi:MAG: T9SS C-terminal target domain-containing protein [Flavobacteriales bacterium]|nr:T9SS C-terminal target domain-containing protein [Flavobacteriales bacterium]